MKSGTGILPVAFCGIGILPMIHGLEAHATLSRLFTHPLRRSKKLSQNAECHCEERSDAAI
jgi:hypothetical protein